MIISGCWIDYKSQAKRSYVDRRRERPGSRDGKKGNAIQETRQDPERRNGRNRHIKGGGGLFSEVN